VISSASLAEPLAPCLFPAREPWPEAGEEYLELVRGPLAQIGPVEGQQAVAEHRLSMSDPG